MSTLSFEQLVKIYDASTVPNADGIACLKIVDQEMLDLVHEIDDDEECFRTTGLAISSEIGALKIGDCVDILIDDPKLGFGRMALNFELFLKSPDVQISEPTNFYIFDDRLSSLSDVETDRLKAYRLVLGAVDILSQAATFFDQTKRTLYFIGNTKVVVPIEYSVQDLDDLDQEGLSSFVEEISEPIHQDRKYTILLEELNGVLANVPEKEAFAYILRNIELIGSRVSRGYKLYISEFSYSKIRRQIESEKLDYLGKLHKTIVDIQGQMLGIPVASIVVASQLKEATICGTQYWSNLAVTAGVWFFLVLLLIALTNQFATLRDIKGDIVRQRDRLSKEFMGVSDQFEDIYSSLLAREKFHRFALLIIAGVGIAGAVFETIAYWKLTSVGFDACSGGLLQAFIDALRHSSGGLKAL